jgi:Transcriptional regulators of sugar metabolism
MIPAKRQQIILSALAERGVLSITELMEWLNVSHMTVRRDIQKLEEEGRVLSVSGGVQLTQKITSEPSHLVKRSLQHDEKSAIANIAAKMVTAGMSIYLDAGTTSLALAERVASVPDLVVVSNDFAVVNLLSQQSECLLYHTGGQVLRQNQSCVGDSATQFLRNLNIDISFLSASSWNARCISTPTEAKVSVKKAAVGAASKRVLICDSSKYGRVGIFNAVPIDMLDAIITDDGLPESAREALKQTGVELLIAKTSSRPANGRKAS